MTYVVTEACIQCKYTDCVEVCPMNCFVEGPNFLAIDPDGCIECAMCVPECPVNAIAHISEVPPSQIKFVALNEQLARKTSWKPITRRKEPLQDHASWAAVLDKRQLLQL